MELYPLKFETIFKDKIWGGNKIKTVLGKEFSPLPNCGETWEVSGVPGNISVVKEGPLEGKLLTELLESYQYRLIGKKVYERFGNEFPLLVKYIDANEDLSIQVHPNDRLARERHNSLGKTEMWYVLQADKGSKLNVGFKKEIDEKTYLEHLQKNTLDEILNFETVEEGDVFFLPSGRVHYIGKGILLAEIQQSSDVTYRIYDFDRVDDKGNKRELHTDLALKAMDYKYYGDYKTRYKAIENQPFLLASCKYFHTSLLSLERSVERDFSAFDSFVIYMAVDGEGVININGKGTMITKGEAILIPAEIKKIEILPDPKVKLLEVHVP